MRGVGEGGLIEVSLLVDDDLEDGSEVGLAGAVGFVEGTGNTVCTGDLVRGVGVGGCIIGLLILFATDDF